MNKFKISKDVKVKIVNFILWILLIIVMVFMYYGYIESNTDYEELYGTIYGKIIKKEFDKIHTVKSHFDDGLDSYYSETMYKLKNTYEYKINRVRYIGHFDNDENYDYSKTITLSELKELDRKYTRNYPLKIYYLKSNNSVSYVNLDMAQTKNSRFYYGISFVTFILLLVVISLNSLLY